MSISLLTLVRGRQRHLENQRIGILQSSLLPDEWVVVGMDQDVDLPATKEMPLRLSRVDGHDGNLPLAKARNHAARISRGDTLIFLDVDCIPDWRMIETFADACEQEPRLWMGEPRYLPKDAASEGWGSADLWALAERHRLQPMLDRQQRLASQRYEMFWSLCFALRRDDFNRIGGFDETFGGYGGEDTDFAFSARKADVPFGHLGATAFHQFHDSIHPPLNHFDAIVANARRFYTKWNRWPMESWLKAFAELGLVRFDPEATELIVLRSPEETADHTRPERGACCEA